MALSFNEGAALGGSLGDLIASGLDAAGLSAKARTRAVNDARFGLPSQQPGGLASLLRPTTTPVAQNAQGMTGSVAGGQATLSAPTPAPTQTASIPAAQPQQQFGQNVKTEDLIAVLRDPNSTDQDRNLAAMLFKGRQPLSATDQADINLKNAQTAALQAKPTNKYSIQDGILLNENTGDFQKVGTMKPGDTREINVNGKNVIAERQPDGTYKPVADAPVQNRDTPVGFSGEQQLSQQIIGQQPIKDYKTSLASLDKMRAGVKDPSPAGDIGLVYAYMKMLDPNSVVREGEFATAENAAGIPAQVMNFYNKAVNGQRLPDSVRKDFLKKGVQFVNAQGKVANGIVTDYRNRATRYKLNPDNVAMPIQDETVDGAPSPGGTPGLTPGGDFQPIGDTGYSIRQVGN